MILFIWMSAQMSEFKWRHFLPEVILQCVRWYCKYGINYRDLEEMMEEQGYPLTIQRSTVGCSIMRQKWKNDYNGIVALKLHKHYPPYVINTDKNPAYGDAIRALNKEEY